MTIEIENFDLINQGNLVAEFDVYIPRSKFRIFRMRLLQGKNGHFVAYRSYARDGSEGKKYYPLFAFVGELDKQFLAKVNEAVKPYVSAEPRKAPSPDLFSRPDEVPF